MVAFRFLYLGLLIGTALAVPVYPRSDIDDVFLATREPANSRKGSQSSISEVPQTPAKTHFDRPLFAPKIATKAPSKDKSITSPQRSAPLRSDALGDNYNAAQGENRFGTSRLVRNGGMKYTKISNERYPEY